MRSQVFESFLERATSLIWECYKAHEKARVLYYQHQVSSNIVQRGDHKSDSPTFHLVNMAWRERDIMLEAFNLIEERMLDHANMATRWFDSPDLSDAEKDLANSTQLKLRAVIGILLEMRVHLEKMFPMDRAPG